VDRRSFVPSVLSMLLLAAPAARAETRSVCQAGCPYATIQAAIDAAADLDTILVGDGVYRENLLLSGRRLTLRSENGPSAAIIDGGAPAPTDATRGSVAEFRNSTCRLEGFTLTHGGGKVHPLHPYDDPLEPPGTVGGGVLVQGSDVTLANCVLRANSADLGAAVAGWRSQVVLSDCLVTENEPRHPPRHAAEIGNPRTTIALADDPAQPWETIAPPLSELSDFLAERTRFVENRSGGIRVWGRLRLHDSLVGGNTNCRHAVEALDEIEVLRSTIRDNDGTGVYLWGEVRGRVIADSTISGNRTTHRGGGITLDGARGLTVSNCTISGNEAWGSDGGGVYAAYDSSLRIVNSVISGNRSAGRGGGVFATGYVDPSPSTVEIINTTVSGNAAFKGGGLYADRSTQTVIVNSIVWGNAAQEGPAEIRRVPGFAPPGTSSLTVRYSNVRGGDPEHPGGPWPGEGNIDARPGFAAPLSASLAPAAGGDYHLTACASGVDAGSGDAVLYPGIPGTDLDGQSRPHGGGYDMGADEADAAPRDAGPEAADDAATTAEDTPVQVNVLANDRFPAGPVESVTILRATHGAAVSAGDGTVTFTPEANYNGRASVHYLVSDGACTSPAELVVEVSAAEDPPFEVCPAGCAYASIQAAIDAAGDGDTVLVHDGTYRERFEYRGKALKVASRNGPGRTILDGGFDEKWASVVSFVDNEGPGSVLSGFTITGGHARYGGGILVDGRPPARFMEQLNPSPRISNCVIEGNSAVFESGNYGGGVLIKYGSPVISRCVIRGNKAGQGAGVFVWGTSPPGPAFDNCIIADNREGLGGGVRIFGMQARFVHCTITGNWPRGVSVDNGGLGSAVTVENSIVWGNGTDLTEATARFSDVVNVNKGGSSNRYQGPWGEGNIAVDPRFVDPAAQEYHIRSDSPCVDLATPGLAQQDIDGEPRPGGAGADMGADEVYCDIVVSPAELKVPARGKVVAVKVSAAAGCTWNAVSGRPWIRILSGAGGTGSGTVSLRVRPNATGRARIGRVTIGGQVFTMRQAR